MAIDGIRPYLRNFGWRSLAVTLPVGLAALYLWKNKKKSAPLDRCHAKVIQHTSISNENLKVVYVSRKIQECLQIKAGEILAVGVFACYVEVEETLPDDTISMHKVTYRMSENSLAGSATMITAMREVVALDEAHLIYQGPERQEMLFFDQKEFFQKLREALGGTPYCKGEGIGFSYLGRFYSFSLRDCDAPCYTFSGNCDYKVQLPRHLPMPDSWTLTSDAILRFEITKLPRRLTFDKQEIVDAILAIKPACTTFTHSTLQVGCEIHPDHFWRISDEVVVSKPEGEIHAKLTDVLDTYGCPCQIALCDYSPVVLCEHEQLVDPEPIAFSDAIAQRQLLLSESSVAQLKPIYESLQRNDFPGHVLISGPFGCGKHQVAGCLALGIDANYEAMAELSPGHLFSDQGKMLPGVLKSVVETDDLSLLILRSADYLFQEEAESSPLQMQLIETLRQKELVVIAVCENRPSASMLARFSHLIALELPNKELRSQLITELHGTPDEALVVASTGLSADAIRQAFAEEEETMVKLNRLREALPENPNYFL